MRSAIAVTIFTVSLLAGTKPVLLSAGDTIHLPDREGERFPLVERSDFQKTLRFQDSKTGGTVQVDNVFGSIEVTGGSTDEVRVTGKKTLRAKWKEDMEEARREVRLDMTERGNTVDLCVNGPFRRADGTIEWREKDYLAQYDFILQVPENTNLVLKTVSDGTVRVCNVKGRMKISNVNGRIEMEGIAGPVKASTINGGISAVFREDPTENCFFKTVNGDVRLSFSEALSADFLLTVRMNGEVFSDFPVDHMPVKAEATRENGRYVYRSRTQKTRVGKGGPEISMETLNGNLVIARTTK
jgi:DUF4097 and DUF4098 domain-containing protein YvlB